MSEHSSPLARLRVGVMDSGVGGLATLRAIRALMPAADLLYAADTRHAPYGDKSPEFISEHELLGVAA